MSVVADPAAKALDATNATRRKRTEEPSGRDIRSLLSEWCVPRLLSPSVRLKTSPEPSARIGWLLRRERDIKRRKKCRADRGVGASTSIHEAFQ